MNFYRLSADDVEYEVGLNNQDAVPILSKSQMSWYSSQERMSSQKPDPFIELLDKRQGSIRAVLRYPVKN